MWNSDVRDLSPAISCHPFKLNQSDFEALYNSGKCKSFREFYDSVFL